MDVRSWRDAAIVVLAFLLIGLVDNFLVNAGYTYVAVTVFAIGYSALVVAVWYRWLRQLDFSGSDSEDTNLYDGDVSDGTER